MSCEEVAEELSVIAIDAVIDFLRRTDVATYPTKRTELEAFLADTRERMAREFRKKLENSRRRADGLGRR